MLIGDKSFWEKGYGSEAIGLVCDYAFRRLDLAKLTAGCYVSNAGSIKVFLNQWFIQEGVLSKQGLCGEERQDGYLLDRINPKYFSSCILTNF